MHMQMNHSNVDPVDGLTGRIVPLIGANGDVSQQISR